MFLYLLVFAASLYLFLCIRESFFDSMSWSLGISKLDQTVLARLMESQIWHQLAGSVWGGFRKGTMTSAHLDDRHFSSSLYATSSFQAATMLLELRESESE